MRATPQLTVGTFIAARGHAIDLQPGQPLFFEGDYSQSVYVCLEGRIRVFVTLPSGRELTMGMKEPGDGFGELSAIDERPRAASAVAVEPSVVAHLPGERFLDELQHEPELAVAVLRDLATQLRTADARLRASSGDSALVRVGHLLIELAALKLRHDRGRTDQRVELDLTQADIAEWIGVTRECAARSLAQLRDAGVVETHRARVVVPDVHALVVTVESN